MAEDETRGAGVDRPEGEAEKSAAGTDPEQEGITRGDLLKGAAVAGAGVVLGDQLALVGEQADIDALA